MILWVCSLNLSEQEGTPRDARGIVKQALPQLPMLLQLKAGGQCYSAGNRPGSLCLRSLDAHVRSLKTRYDEICVKCI